MDITLAYVKKLDRQNKLPELREIARQQDERQSLIHNRDNHLTAASRSRGDTKDRHLTAASGFSEKLPGHPPVRGSRSGPEAALPLTLAPRDA